jgi:chromosomal replication initiator protein
MTVWDRVLDLVEKEGRVSSHSFVTWFRPTSFRSFDGSVLSITVPSAPFRDWFLKNYSSLVSEMLTSQGHTDVRLQCDVESFGGGGVESLPVIEASSLNPKYTFETFVVGSSNQMAHAAAKAVAEVPSKSYNPLFIYGGVGLGKTHLLQAIGHYLLKRNPKLALTYVSSEHFVNEVVSAIRYERILPFRQRYRSIDVLVIDDIQFLSNKERSQEEFFHLFNTLYEAGKQVVISADVPPKLLTGVHERMQSRFSSGMSADVGPPDIETRVVILQRLAAAEDILLPDNVGLFVASKVRSNIRELEGAFNRIVAHASLRGVDIDIDVAQAAMKDLMDAPEKRLSIETVQKFVADHYKVKISDLKARNNSRSVTIPRQVAMYLTKLLTSSSLPEIGRGFGGKHHSTVIHSIRKVETDRKADSDFDRLLNSLIASLK